MVQYNKLEVFLHPAFSKQAELFDEKYELFKFVYVGDEHYSKKNLKARSSRTCRFCGLSYPDTAFSNLSHLLPQLIGNSNLYSDFECDKCNALFSSFENDLAAYLGISRSIVGLHDKKNAPGFTARRIKAKSRSFIGDNILILAPEDIVVKGAGVSLNYTKNPYTPSNVFKAFLKSALSLLDEEDIKRDYRKAIDYLGGKNRLTRGAIIGGYKLSFIKNIPLHVFCFKKRNETEQIPNHVICFNFQSQIISFPIPVDNTLESSNLDEWQTILPPPYFLREKIMKDAFPIPFFKDLTSTTEVKDEEDSFPIQVDPKYLESAWSYNPATDTHQQEKLDLSQIKHIILAKEGVMVDPKELSDFIKKEMGEE